MELKQTFVDMTINPLDRSNRTIVGLKHVTRGERNLFPIDASKEYGSRDEDEVRENA